MMRDAADRYRLVAGTFTETARCVPADAWDDPAPCEGWVARDVVAHMVEWMPGFLADAPVELDAGPSVDHDPVGAWLALSDSLQAALDDPEVAARTFTHGRAGTHTIEDAIASFFVGDILVHTWDLARAAGFDVTLDPDEVHALLEGMQSMEDALRTSGHYGPRVDVPADADEQTRLIAFTGRDPGVGARRSPAT
jgi:uncharacterized protein (TIGR03086 family)